MREGVHKTEKAEKRMFSVRISRIRVWVRMRENALKVIGHLHDL